MTASLLIAFAGWSALQAVRSVLAAVRPDPPMCPRCGEDRLVSYDLVLGRFYCNVCSATWRAGRAR